MVNKIISNVLVLFGYLNLCVLYKQKWRDLVIDFRR